jgi:hypothetical protein
MNEWSPNSCSVRDIGEEQWEELNRVHNLFALKELNTTYAYRKWGL